MVWRAISRTTPKSLLLFFSFVGSATGIPMGRTSLASGTNETPAEATKFIAAICAPIVASSRTYFGFSRMTLPAEAFRSAIALSEVLKTSLPMASKTDFLRTLNPVITNFSADWSKSLFRGASTANRCNATAFEMSSVIYLTDDWPKALVVPVNNASEKTSIDVRLSMPSKTRPQTVLHSRNLSEVKLL